METLKFVQTVESKSPADIRTALYKKGILASYNSDDGRMVCYTSKNDRFNNNHKGNAQKLWLECNGLVLDTKNMKLLVIPPLSFKSNIQSHVVDTYLAKDLYTTYLIDDGTLINLYYWKPTNSWRISTTRGYDMTENQWGSQTYLSILEELLGLYNTNLKTFLDGLNEEWCYTFGFKHRSMHPFQEGTGNYSSKLWYIQSVDLVNNMICDDFNGLFGIPNQKRYEFPEDKQQTSKTLFTILHNCLNDFIDNSIVNYGFILKSKSPTETQSYSHVLLESSLLQKIRQLYYHSDFNQYAREMKYDREQYIVVRSYLDINSHYLFIELFPQYQIYFNMLDTITAELVKSVLNYAKAKRTETIDNQNTARFLYEKISSTCKLVPGNRHNIKLVSSYLLHVNFTDLYYGMLTNYISKSKTANISDDVSKLQIESKETDNSTEMTDF